VEEGGKRRKGDGGGGWGEGEGGRIYNRKLALTTPAMEREQIYQLEPGIFHSQQLVQHQYKYNKYCFQSLT
jgi:hypothetical protein